MVEIKAELLKWCRYGFRYTSGDTPMKLAGFGKRPHGYAMYVEGLPIYCVSGTVLVNPQEYEESVVARIKEILDIPSGTPFEVIKMSPTRIYVDWGEIAHGVGFLMRVAIKADPRPWEKAYTIEIGE